MLKARWLTGGALMAMLPAVPAAAQQAEVVATAEADAAAGEDLPDEIVVTARKFGESLQKTPVAVSAINGELLERQSIYRLEDLSNVVPNLQFTTSGASGTGTLVYMRGIGSNSASLYADSPIAVYVDGVLLPRGSALSFDLPDLARVEALRGPQGTLFGRNTTGGAINLYTTKPTEEAGAKVTASYGTDDYIVAKTVLNTGNLGGSNLRLKLTYAHDQIDGFAEAPGVKDSRAPGFRNTDGVSATLLWEASPDFTAEYRGDYATTMQRFYAQYLAVTPTPTAYYNRSPSLGGAPFLVSPDYIGTEYLDPRLVPNKVETQGHALTLDYALSESLSLKSITAIRELDQFLAPQFTGSAQLVGTVLNPLNPASPLEVVGPFINTGQPGKQDQFSQELQLSGTAGDLTFVAGAFYFDEDIDESLPSDVTFVLSPTTATQIHRRRTYYTGIKSYAGFGQASWRPGALDDKLEVALGIRYTEDHKELNERNTSSTGTPVVMQQLDNKWSKTSGAASLSYQWTPGFMTYVRASNGYKAGGYNPGSLQPAYNPESAISYEAGFKSTLFDRRVRFNVDLFTTTYKDLQVSQFNGANGASQIINAAKARYQGAEAELNVDLGAFKLNGSLGYVDPKYINYFNLGAGGVLIDVAPLAKVINVSKYTFNIGAEYTLEPTAFGTPSIRADYAYRSKQFPYTLASLAAFAPQFPIESYKELSGSIGLADIPLGGGGQTVGLELFGRNLTDRIRRYAVVDFGTALGVTSGFYERGRVIGVRLKADF